MTKNHKQHQASYSELFEQRSGLLEWWFWVGLLGAVCISIYALWISSSSPSRASTVVGNGLYVLMFTVAGGCLYKSLQAVSFLARETRLASQQIRVLEEVDSFDQFFDRAKDSVFKLHIENLHTIARVHPDVNQDNLIEILHSRLLSKNRVVELFSGILVTIGLIGTIIGLIFMMDGLSAIMQKESGSNLMSALFDADGGPMGGLGVAFYTTLVGATLGGVVFRVLTSIVDEHTTRYVSHIAELTTVHVIPALRAMKSSPGAKP